MEQHQNSLKKNQDISLKDLILFIQEYGKEVLAKWKVLGLLCIPFVIYFLYSHFTYIPKYSTKLKFIVEAEGTSNIGLANSILGQFGLRNPRQGFNPISVIEVGKSSELTKKLVVSKLSNGELIGNRLIDLYGYRKKWAKSENPEKVDFFFNDTLDINNRMEMAVFKTIYRLIWGSDNVDGISELDLNFDNGIFSIATSSIDEEITLKISKNIFYNLKTFYEDDLLANQKKSVEIIRNKVDSLNLLVTNKVYKLGSFSDKNRDLLSNRRSSEITILQNEIQAIYASYGDLLKTFEIAEYKLEDNKPLFKEVEIPFAPITPSSSSIFNVLLKAILLALSIGITIVIGKKFYLEIMGNIKYS